MCTDVNVCLCVCGVCVWVCYVHVKVCVWVHMCGVVCAHACEGVYECVCA